MRVAALYDIHGNLPALEAVLGEVHEAAVDVVVVGGDVVPGPMPRATLETLLDLEVDVRFLSGNGERETLAHEAGVNPGALPEGVRQVLRWAREQLRFEQRRLMEGWPQTLDLEIPGLGNVLFCHATPLSDNDIFTRRTPAEVVAPSFQQQGLVVCGHTHMQFDRRVGSTRIVNAGSVGMPFGEPGAYWLLLGPGLELRHTTYDLVAAAERIRATDYPQAEDFAAGNVLEPPTEATMLEVLEGGALGQPDD